MTEEQAIATAHALGCHTSEVLSGFAEWQAWCEREGVDPEVMTFEAWIEEMRRLDVTQ